MTKDTFPTRMLYLVFTITLFIKVYLECHYMLDTTDLFSQFRTAFHLFNGEGIVQSLVDKEDLSQRIYLRQWYWPPGFIFMAALVYYFVADFVMVKVILDIIAITVLWFTLLKTFELVEFSKSTQIFIFLFLGISFDPLFYFQATDLWSMVLVHVSIYVSLRIVCNSAYSILNGLILSILIFLIIFTKYIYYTIFIYPLSLFIYSYFVREDKKILRRFVVLLTLALLILTSSFLWTMKQYSGGFSYLKKEGFQIYWSNLVWLDAFPFKTFFYTRYLHQLFQGRELWNVSLHNVFVIVMYVLSVYFILILFYYVYQSFLAKKFLLANNLQKLYTILFATTSVLNVSYLVFLSLILAPETYWTDFWTYVQETRYYAPSMLFFIIFFVFYTIEFKLAYQLKILNTFLIGLILAYASFYMFYRVVGVLLYQKVGYNIERQFREFWDLNVLIEPYVEKQQTIVISDHSRAIRYTYFTEAPSIDYDDLKELDSLKASQPITILLYFTQTIDEDKAAFIEKHKAKLVNTQLDKNLYEISLQP